MTPELYNRLVSQQYNRIPFVRTVLADTETPLSAYLKLAKGAYSYLFESVQGGEKWGRYSFIGLPAKERFEVYDHTVKLFSGDTCVESFEASDPLAEVEKLKDRYKVASLAHLPDFSGGLVGYFGYDIVRYIEPKLAKSTQKPSLDNPDILLLVSNEILVFDNLKGCIHIIVHAETERADAFNEASRRLDELEGVVFATGATVTGNEHGNR